MKVHYVMTIGSIIYVKEKGYIIIGDKKRNPDDNRLYIGKIDSQIFVESNGCNYKFKIKDVKAATSIGGELNIGIYIYDSENIHRIKVGDKLYSILEE